MPKNDEPGLPAEAVTAETAMEKFEREQLSRRQALKKLGITSAMATFALFSVDDLARMVGKAMQQRAADNKVVEQVAKELQQAGIALADTGVTPCSHCLNEWGHQLNGANLASAGCLLNGSSADWCNDHVFCPAMNDALYAYNGCVAVHCTDPNPQLATPKLEMPEQCLGSFRFFD